MPVASEIEIEMLFVRHGRTKSNREYRYLGGRTDEPLLENETEALQQMKHVLEGKWSEARLFSSPMLRCRQTAEVLFPGKEPTVIEEFREIDFGRFEGKNYQELSGDADYQAWIDSGGMTPFPEGESREEFIGRSCQGMNQMLRLALTEKREAIHYSGQTKVDAEAHMVRAKEMKAVTPVCAVVHGGTIMAILSSLTGRDYFDFQVKNGEGYCCTLRIDKEEGVHVVSYERICAGVSD